jgi:hypothetical protein
VLRRHAVRTIRFQIRLGQSHGRRA